MPKREVIAEGNWLKLEKIGNWEFASRKKGTGAVFLPAMTKDGEYILIEQFRPAVQAQTIEWAAGIVGDIDEDENFMEAGVRELLEETGYLPTNVTEVPFKIHSSPGMVTEGSNYLVCLDCEKTEDGGGVDDEEIITHIVPQSDLMIWIEEQAEAGKVIGTSVFTGLLLLDHVLSMGV